MNNTEAIKKLVDIIEHLVIINSDGMRQDTYEEIKELESSIKIVEKSKVPNVSLKEIRINYDKEMEEFKRNYLTYEE